ncbi:tagaturonate reductase [Pullulanibacillus sp. KACC 23026]|uniref:tagaturonate reductase n=1 Tax=Pullulanibacillus sp. KACC 23026 TaxID=3028315 RepID=UPI0023B14F5C|nr:tagaturonate reductase [Pullulanibacillus sp. KACC 23026]WEG13682.1 tagaturonate reductase [Pullulanibacillus sp. KACC 23026]
MEKLNKTIVETYETYPEKVLQFGEGNFMRGFVDWQIEVMNKLADFNGSVVVVQPRGFEKIEKLNEQDGLYTLYLQGIKDGKAVREHTLIHSISRGLNLFTQYEEFVQLAENPSLRFIFSNTTEAGIAFDETDQLEDRPQKSYPGKLAAFLYYRFKAFGGDKDKGFIIIPCELVENGGKKLKEIVIQFAELWNLGEDFIRWVQEANTFCSSLVDRIVSGYPKETSEEMTQELGYQDDFLVVGEPFHLWVIEGPQWIREEFPAHMAGLNTLFVDDLTPYRTRKVRILNGAHTAMTPVSYLYGLNTVAESVEHPVIGRFIKETIFDEIIPTLDLPLDELTYFANAVLERFSNPFIKHYLLSISLNSLSKYKTRNLPSLLEFVNRKHQLPDKLVFSLAALISFYKGKRGEEEIPLEDEPDCLELVKRLWKDYDGTKESTNKIVHTVLGAEKIWEMDLNEVPGLTDLVTRYLYDIESKGIERAVKTTLQVKAEKGGTQ